MNTKVLSVAGQLSDQDLVARVKVLARREQEATAALIAHLAVLDERELYLAEGCSSMFTYCVQVLHLSEYATYSRIEAARAARKYPVILDLLSDGSVNLTTVGLLVPMLTRENHVDLLAQPPVPSSVRRLPTPRLAAETLGPGDVSAPTLELSSAAEAPALARRPFVVPLAPQQYKVQFTASAETHAKLMRAQELLRSQIPDGDVGEVIDRALTALLKELTRQKFAATDRPRESKVEPLRNNGGPVPRSRHIPAEVKRTVWARDEGQCAFMADGGRRCTERAFLEFHHVVPYGAGGEATVENIQLRCRAHNGFEAEMFFGRRTYRSHSTDGDLSSMASSTGSGPRNNAL